MGSTVYIEKTRADSLRLKNTTGTALVQYEFVAMAGKSLVADEAIASTVVGSLTNANGMVLEAADFVVGEGTFGTANAAVYWDPSTKKFSDTLTANYYLVGYVYEILAGGVVKFVAVDALLAPTDLNALQAIVADITELSGRPFRKTVTFTAAAAGTPVVIVAASEVTGTNKVFVTDFLLSVNGGTAWTDTTATIVTLQDTAASPVVGATFAKAQLTSQAQLGKLTAGVTLAAPVRTGVGFTAAKGLNIAADGIFAAGSDISITVTGFIGV